MKVKNNTLRFTKKSDQLKDNEVLQYILDEERVCPGFLPLD
jgi:hypothetical protein